MAEEPSFRVIGQQRSIVMTTERQRRSTGYKRRLCTAWLGAILGGVTPCGRADAQTVSTVREDEFRSRWANYQVDLPPQTGTSATNNLAPQTGLLGLFGKSLDHYFSGPLEVRASLSTGWEYSDEKNLRPLETNRSYNSFFMAPTAGIFYNREFGPLTLSARYSAGYTYYFDRDYVGSSGNGGIFSQTAGLDLDTVGIRDTFHSSTTTSYGNGDDIESGQQRDRFAIGESLVNTYLVHTDVTLGGNASVDYSTYSGGTVQSTDTLNDTARIYAEYSGFGKTRLRLEASVGQQEQGSSARSYVQSLFAVHWTPTPKLNLDAGLGYGSQRDSGVVGESDNGSHLVYTFTVDYAATEKTSGSFHVGYEGADVDPDLSLKIQWQPRQTTTLGLSVYQASNFSTFLESQSIVTRGILASAQQRLFDRINLNLSGGVEQSKGYSSLRSGQTANFEDPYYFGSISLLWEINSWLAFQTYYRGYTGMAGLQNNGDNGLQSRASVSFRITF